MVLYFTVHLIQSTPGSVSKKALMSLLYTTEYCVAEPGV